MAIYVAVFDPNAIYSDAFTINATMSQLHLVIGHGTHVKWSHISAHILGCATLARTPCIEQSEGPRSKTSLMAIRLPSLPGASNVQQMFARGSILAAPAVACAPLTARRPSSAFARKAYMSVLNFLKTL